MRLLPSTIALVLLLPAGHAVAQTSPIEARLRDQLRSTVLQLREAQNDLASAKADKSTVEQERDQLKIMVAKLKATKGGESFSGDPATSNASEKTRQLQQQLVNLRSENAVLSGKLDSTKAALATANETIGQAKLIITQLRGDRDKLNAAANANTAKPLEEAKTALNACIEKNEKLIRIGNEILASYAKIGLGTVVKSKEPFLQTKRVKLENTLQAFGDQIYDARCDLRPERVRATESGSQQALAQ